mgnify:CR=1 FL=1
METKKKKQCFKEETSIINRLSFHENEWMGWTKLIEKDDDDDDDDEEIS